LIRQLPFLHFLRGLIKNRILRACAEALRLSDNLG
jgi:hypothetical protein